MAVLSSNMIAFDHIGEVITVANCHFTMDNIKYALLDYIRASNSALISLANLEAPG